MPARGSSSRNKSIALCVGGAAGTICTAPKPSLPMGLCAQGVPCALNWVWGAAGSHACHLCCCSEGWQQCISLLLL